MPLIFFILESIFLIYFERKFYKVLYTPVTMLAIPALFIAILVVIYYKQLGYYPICWSIFNFWSVGLFSFWLGGIILSLFLCPNGLQCIDSNGFIRFIQSRKKTILGTGLLLMFYVDVNIALNITRVNFVLNDEWETIIGTGIFSHISIFFKLISIFSFICISRNNSKWTNLGFISIFLSSIILSLLYTVKSAFLILLLSVILLRMYIYGIKFRIKYIIYLLLLAFLIFYLSYSLIFGYWAPLDFILNHILFYFTSSFASFSSYLRHGYPMGVNLEFLFMPIVNTYNKIVGIPLNEVISELWTQVGPDSYSNVKTFFGTIFIYGGYIGGIFTSFVWGVVVYLSFILFYKGYWFFAANTCLMLIALFFGWFDLYFNTFAYYEYMFYSILLFFTDSIIRLK